MQELISYFAIFDGFKDLTLLKNYETLEDNIKFNILQHFHKEKKYFHFTEDKSLQHDIEKTLHQLSKANAKHNWIYKNVSQTRGKEISKILYDFGIIEREISREKELPKHLGPLKKEFRGYRREDKVKFTKEFYRFWFAFIYPRYDDLEKNEYNQTLKNIEENSDYFVSRFFEELSNDLLSFVYHDSIKERGAYWDKDVEIDLFVKLKDGTQIVGECKWKNHKVSKNVLNKLKKVAEKAGIRADFYALFSKNGFSLELEKGKDKQVLLYDLNSFKRLLS